MTSQLSLYSPGASVWVGDRSGKTLVHVAAGVREAGSSDKLTTSDAFRMFSTTKLITAIAAMQLIEQGKIDPDAKLDDVVPDMAGAKDCTLRMLLTHTGGHAYGFFHPTWRKELDDKKVGDFDGSRASINGPLVNKPGEQWEYGANMDWAGLVIEKVSGQSLEDYFSDHIFKPLGIEGMTFYPSKLKAPLTTMHKKQDGSVVPTADPMAKEESIEVLYGGAGLYSSSTESYGQILCTLLNKGTHPVTGKQILKPESVDELMRDQLTEQQTKRMYELIEGFPAHWSNTFTILEGAKKNWSYAGCKTPDGLPTGRSGNVSRSRARKARSDAASCLPFLQSVWWAGLVSDSRFATLATLLMLLSLCTVQPVLVLRSRGWNVRIHPVAGESSRRASI